MSFLWQQAEQKIQEAVQKGELQGLPGEGKPLMEEDLSHVPPELRAAYKILKNSNVLPQEMTLQQEVIQLEDLLKCCKNEKEREKLKRNLTEKKLRFDLMMEQRRQQSSVYTKYEEKIHRKFGF